MKCKTCLTALIILTLSMAVSADSLSFKTYNASNTAAGYSELTDVAVSPDGLVMTVWCETTQARRNKITARIYNSKTKTMGSNIVIPNQFGDNIFPRVCAGDDGEFFVVWALCPTGTEAEHFEAMMFAHYKDGAFSKPYTVAPGMGAFPTVSYDELDQTVSVYWQHTMRGAGGLSIQQALRKRSPNGTWGNTIYLTNNTYAGDRIESCPPDINGREYVVYEYKVQIGPEHLEIAFNHTRSGDWMRYPIVLTANKGYTFQPKVAVSPDGKEVYITWFVYAEKTYYGQYITFTSEKDTKGTWGPVTRIAAGHNDHKWYDSGLAYHGDRFYFTYINDGVVKYRSFHNNKWSDATTIAGSSYPRIARMGSSPYAGIAISWMKRDGTTPPESMTAFADYAVAKRIRIYPIASAAKNEVREQSLFFHNNYNEVTWINSEDNLMDGENTAKQFLLFRSEDGSFDYSCPYKTFTADASGNGFSIIETDRRYAFVEMIGRSELSKSYRYAIIAVDEDGNQSDPVLAQ